MSPKTQTSPEYRKEAAYLSLELRQLVQRQFALFPPPEEEEEEQPTLRFYPAPGVEV